MNKPCHITVIGAGIVGVSCAAFAQMRGGEVTLIDPLGPGRGCSFGNAGGVVVAAVNPLVEPDIWRKLPGWLIDPLGPLKIRWRHLPAMLPWLRAVAANSRPDRFKRNATARASLCRGALEHHRILLARAGVLDLLDMRDGLRLYDSEAQYRSEEDWRALKRRFGLTPERLTIAEAREREPALAEDFHCASTWGGWYHVKDPHRVVTAIAEAVIADGGRLIQDRVVTIERVAGRVTGLVLESGNRHPVDHVVIAAGAWSGALARQVGARVLLESERGYHLTIPDPGVSLSRTVNWAARHGSVTPMAMGLRVSGTDEFAGLDAPPDWRRADVLWRQAKRLLPGLRPLDDTVSRWMGHRPGTPDGLPVIAAAPDAANAWLAFGHGHMGLTWGPLTGRAIAAMIAADSPPVDITPFSPHRF